MVLRFKKTMQSEETCPTNIIIILNMCLKMSEKPEAIMMKIPDAFFTDNKITGEQFVNYYKWEAEHKPEWCFYHFINIVPTRGVRLLHLLSR